MRIGVPREIKEQEYRVGLTPDSAREFTAAGHELSVETGAGAGINAPDQAYLAAGARIVGTAEEIFATSDLIIKVKEPQEREWTKLRENQIIFTFLHLAADSALTRGLLSSGCTAVAYETVTGPDGQGLPLLAPMSEVAGRLAIEAAGVALQRQNGGCGVLLGGVPGVPPARVTVLGGGVAGTQAARMAAGLGADVTILDCSLPRLRQLDELFKGRAKTRFASAAAIEDTVASADGVIGAVLIPGASAPKLVPERMLSSMRQGAVLVDISIDQGGCFESSRATTHALPTFIKSGIVHYCVANMPGAVPFTSTHALNHAMLPYGLALAAGGHTAMASNPGLRSGLNVHRGHVTHPAIAASLGFELKEPEAALAA
ncbi:MAG: alanine dehydrogenase [Beijerinckiaceae bacterium]|nr:alanine dehydrogenase [Beijerinckiaceae bacterium]MCI0735573.1 alanine dehydrogenase [Beijerinckiaceae bacterium]